MVIEKVIKWGLKHPKKLFQIDGFGALLSAILLGIVLVRFNSVFGIPKFTLYFLALFPCLFAIYDLYCYQTINKNFGPHLRGIAIANLLYCILSIGLALYHSTTVTILGWAYIVLEVIVLLLLSTIELEIARKVK